MVKLTSHSLDMGVYCISSPVGPMSYFSYQPVFHNQICSYLGIYIHLCVCGR